MKKRLMKSLRLSLISKYNVVFKNDRYRFWKKKSEHCPETRVDISNQHRKAKKLNEKKDEQPKRVRKLFADCGRPYNINEARITFQMIDERDRYELNLEIYKYRNIKIS